MRSDSRATRAEAQKLKKMLILPSLLFAVPRQGRLENVSRFNALDVVGLESGAADRF